MNSNFEQKNTKPTMAEMQAMQKTALRRSMDKAGNIQKSITLTEENWTGLTSAVEMTGQSVLKLQESVGHLLTDEQMDTMLKAQVQLMMAEHMTAISEMQKAVRELNESNSRHWTQVQNSVTDRLYLPTIILVLWELVRHLFLLD